MNYNMKIGWYLFITLYKEIIMKKASVFLRILGVLVFCGAITFAQNKEGNSYKFFLDGSEITSEILAVQGLQETPAQGDVIDINGLLLVLGPPGVYKFKTTPEDDGRLLCEDKDGRVKTVGISVTKSYKDGNETVNNPFAKLTDAEIKGLNGVYLDAYPDDIDNYLAKINPESACVYMREDFSSEKFPPAFPAGLKYLRIEETSSSGTKDYSGLKRLVDLKYFGINRVGEDFNAGLLRQCVNLRYLDLSGNNLLDIEALAGLKELESLSLAWTKTRNIGFIAGMVKLKSLDIRCTEVKDISTAAGLKNLHELQANSTPLEKLPETAVPSLRILKIMSTSLTDAQIGKFTALNPQCRVICKWSDELFAALKGVSLVKVRSGGTCHRNPAEEKELFKLDKEGGINEFLKSIEIDEQESGFHCMCCGEPSIEFYKGEKLLVTLGLHHGRSLRWENGEWPGDGLLTKKSAKFICGWLSKRGIDGPAEEMESEMKREEAQEKIGRKIKAMVPAGIMNALKTAESKEDVIEAFKTGIPDETKRAELLLKLLDCNENSWSLSTQLDSMVQLNMEEISGKSLSKAVENMANDPAGANGAAKLVFSEEKWKDIEPEVLEKVIAPLAMAGMTHPRQINRRRTVHALGEIKTAGAIEALKKILDEDIIVRKLIEEDAEEPGGMVEYRGFDREVKEACSDRAYAALKLAELGRKECVEKIREFAGNATGEDKKIYEKALKLLE